MAKRKAIKDLNHDNWAEEEKPEDAGLFEKAPTETLQGRVIRKAKRISDGSFSQSPSIFSSFKGFETKPSGIITVSSPASKMQFDGFGTSQGSESVKKSNSNGSDTKTEAELSPEYLSSLRSLNEAIQEWLRKHMEVSPYCDFTPAFKDYEKHIQDLEKKFPKRVPKPHSISSNNEINAQATSSDSALKMGSTSESTPFRFSFADTPATSSAQDQNDAEEDTYVPPKNEFTVVEETDAIYSKRCKLFFKKENNYVEKGVGMLYLKHLENKVQLLIRADTSLGNILLNIFLNSTLPLSRIGKNNVAVVCIPNPPLDPNATAEPTTFLIRVRTDTDADELLEMLQKHKDSAK